MGSTSNQIKNRVNINFHLPSIGFPDPTDPNFYFLIGSSEYSMAKLIHPISVALRKMDTSPNHGMINQSWSPSKTVSINEIPSKLLILNRMSKTTTRKMFLRKTIFNLEFS